MSLEIFTTIYASIFGLFLGSFLNVVIERTHEEKSWWSGRSKCDKCGKTLEPIELIPLFSFLFQKGKCRNCKIKLSWQYPLIELVSGIICGFVAYKFGFRFESLVLAIIGLLLLGNFISDLKYMELPEVFSIPTIFLSIFYTLKFTDLSLKDLAIGIVFGFLFFFTQYVLTKGRGIGTGDFRLGVIMGGLLGWPLVVAGIAISYIGGSLISLILLATKKLNRKSAVPLGVFLIPGLVLCFLFKTEISVFIDSYLLLS